MTIYGKRRKHLRFELAQTRKYSLSEKIVNEFVYSVYDKTCFCTNAFVLHRSWMIILHRL